MESNDERIWPVLNTIIACDRFEHVRDHILQPLKAIIGADSAAYIEISHRPNEHPKVKRSYFLGENINIIDQYLSGFYHEDPLIFPATKTSLDAPTKEISRVQLQEDGKLQKLDKRTRYYKQFIEAYNFNDILGHIFPIGGSNDHFICVGFHKYSHASTSIEVPSFRLDDYYLLEKLTQPLGTTFNHIHNKSMSSELKNLLSLLEYGYQDTHYILFDEQMMAQHMSASIYQQYDAKFIQQLNLKLLHSLSNSMCDSIAEDGLYYECTNTFVDGLGQVKFLLSKNACGQISHLLMWDKKIEKSGFADIKTNAEPQSELTYREKDVINQLILGKSNKLIAHELHISIRTVENHLRSIYEKLGVHTRAQLVHAIYGRSLT